MYLCKCSFRWWSKLFVYRSAIHIWFILVSNILMNFRIFKDINVNLNTSMDVSRCTSSNSIDFDIFCIRIDISISICTNICLRIQKCYYQYFMEVQIWTRITIWYQDSFLDNIILLISLDVLFLNIKKNSNQYYQKKLKLSIHLSSNQSISWSIFQSIYNSRNRRINETTTQSIIHSMCLSIDKSTMITVIKSFWS